MANNANGMGAFSSRGPCTDERIKPDIVAPGIAIISTRTDLNQAFEQWEPATSRRLRRPTTLDGRHLHGQPAHRRHCSAGAPVLRRRVARQPQLHHQRFREHARRLQPERGPREGHADQRRLGHDSRPVRHRHDEGDIAGWDTGHDLPNNVEGYGRVDLYHSLFPNLGYGANANRVLEVHDVSPGLTTGVNDSYTFNISNNANPLIVTLVWTDPYGGTAGGTALVNTTSTSR